MQTHGTELHSCGVAGMHLHTKLNVYTHSRLCIRLYTHPCTNPYEAWACITQFRKYHLQRWLSAFNTASTDCTVYHARYKSATSTCNYGPKSTHAMNWTHLHMQVFASHDILLPSYKQPSHCTRSSLSRRTGNTQTMVFVSMPLKPSWQTRYLHLGSELAK